VQESLGEFAKRGVKFWVKHHGRPSLMPWIYLRLLLLEHGIAGRAADSFRRPPGQRIGIGEDTPDHLTI
jgi:hypothetical protein